MRFTAIAMLLGTLLAGGCATGKYIGSGDQPYLTPERTERGWVLVFTGIEGRSGFNQGIADGLAKGGPQQAPPPGGEKPKPDGKGKGPDDVIDAEYEVKE